MVSHGEHGFAPKGETNVSRLGGDGWIYRRIKADKQLRRRARTEIEGEMLFNTADKQPSRGRVVANLRREHSAQQFVDRGQRNVSPPTLNDEVQRKLNVLALDFTFVLTVMKLDLHLA